MEEALRLFRNPGLIEVGRIESVGIESERLRLTDGREMVIHARVASCRAGALVLKLRLLEEISDRRLTHSVDESIFWGFREGVTPELLVAYESIAASS